MKVAHIFKNIFSPKVQKIENVQLSTPIEFERTDSEYDKNRGLIVQSNDTKNDVPIEQQMSQPQDWTWKNPDHVYSKDEVDSNIFMVHSAEGEPISADLDFNSPDGKYMLKFLTFDSTTFQNTPRENLPPGWDPDKIIEDGRSIGQNVEKMHKMGYTGKGISVAVIDSPMILHDDLKSSLVSYNKMRNVKQTNAVSHYHGNAVSDIFVGDKDGVAPDANLHYYATNGIAGDETKLSDEQLHNNFTKSQREDDLRALKQIIEHNSTCDSKDKIRVVSLSWGINKGEYGYEEYRNILKSLYDDGVFVATGDMNMMDESITGADLSFNILAKKDQTKPQNDFSNYVVQQNASDNPERTLCVLSGDRTVASATDPTKYRHDSTSSTSWTVPALAGIYTCALQCAEENGVELNPKIFWDYALKTGVTTNDDNGQFAGYAIDTEALCRYIENEAKQNN